jgi:hypothetical protein
MRRIVMREALVSGVTCASSNLHHFAARCAFSNHKMVQILSSMHVYEPDTVQLLDEGKHVVTKHNIMLTPCSVGLACAI